MFRYFFDVTTDGELREDEVGLRLFAQDVKAEACHMAVDILHELTKHSTPEWWLMEVRNERREVVGRLSFVLSGFEGER